MKNLMKYLSAVIVALFCIGFTACSSDDDEDGSGGGKGSSTLTIDSKKTSVPYACWHISEADRYNNRELHLEFFSYDFISLYTNPTAGKYPTSVDYIGIDCEIDESMVEPESMTIPGGSYHLYVALGVAEHDEGWQAENWDNATSDSPLVIKRSGNTYTVTIENAKIYHFEEGDNPHDQSNTASTLSFSYKGSIGVMPEGFFE